MRFAFPPYEFYEFYAFPPYGLTIMMVRRYM
jgi:hypothetical protein